MAYLLLFVTSLSVIYVFLRYLLAFTQDNKEPVALATKIPFLSPIMGMRKKAKFYLDMRSVF